MRRPILILFLVLVASSIPAGYGQAQNEGRWEDGCDPRAIEAIDGISDLLDYRSACGVYRTCDPSGQADSLCQMRALQALLAQCPTNDMICEDGALLYAAAILIYDDPLQESASWIPPESIIEGVPQALSAYWEGDYGAALDTYNLTSTEDSPHNTMLPFSRAILYQHLNLPDEALAEYEGSFSTAFDQPITWYARSQLLGTLGRDEEASFDVLALSVYLQNQPDLASLISPLEAAYPIANEQLEDWALYPVIISNSGVGGIFVDDLTLEPSRPIQLAMFPELNTIIAVGLQNWSSESLFEPSNRVQRLTSTDRMHYRLEYPSFWENSGSIGIIIDGDIVRGSENISFFEGSFQWMFMLAPADESDPRETISDDTRYCTDGVRSRVDIGSRVRTVSYGTGISVEEHPGSIVGDSMPHEGNGPEVMTIIGGPECVDDTTWWMAVSDDGGEGWIAENRNNTYMIVGTTADPATFVCTGSPEIRLQVGENGRVIPGSGPNNLRELPDLESEAAEAIPENGTFTVLGGPVCADNLAWWYVDYNGTAGWTVEGQGDVYWLEVVGEE